MIPTNQFEYLECISSKKLAEKMEFDSIKEKEGSRMFYVNIAFTFMWERFLPSSTYLEIKKLFHIENLLSLNLTKFYLL